MALLKHVSKNITSDTFSHQDAPYRGIITVEFDIGGSNEK